MLAILDILKNLLFIALGVGGIGALIFFHELGHYLFCKLFSIKTPSFSIGFGPRLFTKRMWDTDFVISAIPLGGYVEIAGLAEVGQGEQEDAHATGEYAFSEKPYYQKALVLLAGIFFNILFAYAVFIGVHMTGAPASPLLYPETATTRIAHVLENSPAAEAGLKEGDRILAINTIPLNDSITSVTGLIKASDTQVIVDVERDGAPQSHAIAKPHENTQCPPHLGIQFAMEDKAPLGFIESIKKGIQSTHYRIKAIARSFLQLFKKCDTSSMGGPIRIISMIAQGAADGPLVYLLFLAMVSLNLAVFNLIPVPILDGGQLLIQTIESLTRRSLPLKAREYIFVATWLTFIALTVYLSFYDIKALITPYLDTIKSWFN